MALVKFTRLVIVALIVCFVTSTLGQSDMHSMEAKHRSMGNRPPPFTYFAQQQPVIYGVPPPHHRAPSYSVQRPTYVAPPSYPVRPSYSSPAYYQNQNQAQRVPAYQIPYPAPRPLPTYAAPAAPKNPHYSDPAVASRQPTYVTPIYSSPSSNCVGRETERSPATPIYGQSPPTTTPTPTKVPSTYSAPYPSPIKPQPYTYSAPSAPVTGPSLLDLPWVKPLYARSPSTPSTATYSWNVQEVRPAVTVKDDSEEDVGVFISSVNTVPVPVPTATPVRSQDFEVRAVPQETVATRNPPAPVIAPATTPRSFVIRDESEEDVRIVQEVTRQTPMPMSPLIIRDDSQAVRFAPLPVTTQAPLVPVVIRDDSEEDVQISVQQRVVPASVPLPTTTQVQNVPVLLRDDSNEVVQIVQQVIPFAPRTTQLSVNPIAIRDDSIEDFQIVQQFSISTPSPRTTTTSTPVNAFVIRDDSVEDVQTFQRVQQVSTTTSLPSRATQPLPANPIFIQDTDDSNEDIQLVQRAQQVSTATPSPRLTQTPAIPIVIRDDSNENDSIVQGVRLNSPVPPQPTETAIPQISLVRLDDNSDEDLLFRDVPLTVQTASNVPAVSASIPATAQAPVTTLFEDSLEDIRILQGAPGSPPLGTVTRDDSREVRPDVSNEDIELRIISQAVTASSITEQLIPTTSAPPRVFLVDSIEDTRRNPAVPPISDVRLSAADVLLVNSNEDVRLAQEVSLRNVPLSGPIPGNSTQPRVVLVDSAEDIQIAQQLSLSNASPSGSATTPRVILVESAEDIQAQTVNPILQSANIVFNQDSREVPDRSDEEQIQTTVTISQVSVNLANSTSL